MRTTRMIAVAATALFVGSGLPLRMAHSQQMVPKRTDVVTHNAPLRETETVVADQPIPNLPGKRLVSVIVDYPPGVRSLAHRHAASAFIYAYVLSGEIRSAVNDEPARIYRTGESWFESPGSHHRVSANASDTASARLLAVFIIDDSDEQLTFPDPQ